MRTDCHIDLERKLRLPNIPLCSPGRLSSAGRGDIVEHEAGLARVIGVVTADDLDEPHLCVAVLMGGSCVWERWLHPNDVWNCWSGDHGMNGALWLFSPEFLGTPVDMARDCCRYLIRDLLAAGAKGLEQVADVGSE